MIPPPYRDPDSDCGLCPRLAAFRQANRAQYPQFRNMPVPPFGSLDSPLLIVGLAPGLKGANATGRPFTGDYAGDLLYATLLKHGFAEGEFLRRADDGLRLTGCRVTNAVRCVPPQNKPETVEIVTCRGTFLVPEFAAMPRLRAVLALGAIAHGSVLAVMENRLSAYKFRHGAEHDLGGGVTLFDSYHCSRYNTNTGVLTAEMSDSIVERIRDFLAGQEGQR